MAVVLTGLTLLICRTAGDPDALVRCAAAGAADHSLREPAHAAELLVEGQPFWDSFFGYHNLQRFTSVVNDHLQPWWFFGPVMRWCLPSRLCC